MRAKATADRAESSSARPSDAYRRISFRCSSRAMSVWFRDHADHHMSVLLNADGPFKGCKPAAHAERLEQLPTTPPADGRATLR